MTTPTSSRSLRLRLRDNAQVSPSPIRPKRHRKERTSVQYESPLLEETIKYIETCSKLRATLKQGAYSDIERGDYSDFKVKCFEKVFYLHRASVCPQSRFFAAALRPGSFLESKTAEVLLPEDDPRIFAFLLQLMYLGEIDADSISKPEGVIDYVKLYVMTDKYGGPGIIASAFEHAQAQISIVLFELSTAKGDMADNDNQNTWDIFAEVVEYVYSNLPSSVDQLKCSLVKDAASKWKDLSTDKQILKDFLRAVPEFAVDILSVPAMLNNIN